MSARVATIDIGTNSVLLLVAERTADGLRPLVERATITRLGEGVDATGELSEDACKRTLACLAAYAEELVHWQVDATFAVGTSAMRDARGGASFCDRAEAVLGTRPAVISGPREAELTFEGALCGIDAAGSLAIFDIGGGSTEIITGHRDENQHGRLEEGVSLDIGSVRLTERHVRTDPPSPSEIEAIRLDVRSALAAAPPLAGRTLVGVAGTVTTLTAFAHGVAPYDAERVHGAVLERAALERSIRRLAALPLAERRALAAIEAKRADVIVAGALIMEEVARAATATRILASDRGVRWGLALEWLRTFGG